MGGSSGGEGRTPYEAPDSGRSTQQIKIVEVISEGEIQGLVNGAKSVFLDNTPIQAEDDSYNFTNIETAGRIGSQDQAVMVGFDTTEKEISVGTEVRKRTPLTRTITDGKVTRLRLTLGVSALFRQEDNGDTLGATVDFKITVGSQVYNLSIDGKYSSQYLRNLVIDSLPPVPFTVKVERMQDDSKSQRLQNKTIWASYTEIIDTDFAYPNTALVGIKFDSDYFSNIPTRSYEIYGIKIKVPSNYDPVTRTYSGLWDGTFKIAYSDNPALILMDIVTNKRYGLGHRLGEFGVDKWALYQAAQYCDQMIPDGYGGKRPRFTCNVWMTEQRSAYDVINDICSIFRAMPVWNGTELTVIMDRPSDPVWTYTNANVINGEFSRQYSAVKARRNAIQVEYQDAANNYEKTIEYVSNDDDIRKYGLNLKKVVAFGCTNRGQAYCTGRWILETERLETETITFSVGSEGLMHIPGDIIRVSDNNYAGTDIGGRVLSFNGHTVTLDRAIQLNGNSYFCYINAEAKHSHIRILRAKGNVITLDSEPVGLTDTSIWSLTTQTITSRLYRAMSIAENDNGSYTIVALQHEPQKEAIVDNGAVFEPVNTTLHQAPKVEHLDVDLTSGNAKLTWQTTSGVGTVTYDVRIIKAGKLYAQYKGLTSSEVAFDNLPDGEYQIVIQARNASGQIVSEKSKTFTINRPPVPQNVQVLGGLSEISLAWDYVDNVTQTEIWASETNDIRTAKRIAKVLASFYSHAIGARQIRYYWLRHTRGQNVGDFYQQQGLSAETGADIDAELALLNEKLGQNIIDEVFDTAMPARKLEMTKTVARIDNPTENIGHNQLYNEADGKLYVWDGRKYTAKVQAVDLEGKLASSQLDQALINQLTQASSTANNALSKANTVQSALAQEVNQRTQAIQAETRARTTAISAEVTARTQALQAEANARGTAVSRLEQVDRDQAQLITTATAKADNALSGLSEERLARIAGDNAESQARTVLTTRVANAESSIATLQNSVTSANRSVSELSQNLNAKIDGMSVGGRNLLLNSNQSLMAQGTINFKLSRHLDYAKIRDLVLSCDVAYTNAIRATTSGAKWFRIGAEIRVHYIDGTNQYLSVWRFATVAPTSFDGRIFAKFTMPADKIVRAIDSVKIQIFDIVAEAMIVKNPKLELGTIATDWSPAPEDVEQSISSVSAELTSYKSAQAEIDRTQSEQLVTHTARLGEAESKIQTTEQSLTTLRESTATRFNDVTANFTRTNQNVTDLSSRISTEETARADGDKSNADKIASLTSRLGATESTITNIQSTKADKTEVSSIAQTALQAIWKADAKTAVDSLQIGGRNLLRNSSQLITGWGGSVTRVDGEATFIGKGSGVFLVYTLPEIPEIGAAYTISFLAKSNQDGHLVIRFRRRDNTTKASDISKTILINSREYKLYTVTLVYQDIAAFEVVSVNFEVVSYAATGIDINFKLPKMEKGNIATGWSPAPEDIESSVNAVSADLTTYKATQANVDKAQTDQITAHTARLGTAESKISAAEQTLTTLNSSVATKFSEVAANFTQVNRNLTANQTDFEAKIVTEQKARADGDKANSDKIATLTSRVGAAESTISNIESTKASKTEVASIAQQSLQSVWQADAQAKVDSVKVGGRNLILRSATSITQTQRHQIIFDLSPSIDYAKINSLVISCDVNYTNATRSTVADAKWFTVGAEVRVWLDDKSTFYLNIFKVIPADGTESFNGRISKTYVVPEGRRIIRLTAPLIRLYDIVADDIVVKNPKLELGTIATDWTPAPEDVEQSIDVVSAELTSYKLTQSNKEQAQATQISGLTTRLGNAESSLSTTSQSITTLNGTVSAMHTIQAVAITGGKKAIAGISMGASGSESSVIVMADKFNVVKNAQDGNVKPMFGVVNNKVAVNGDLIADGTVSARMMATDSVQAGAIAAGAIRANHIAAGEISADKLTIGLGGNLIFNPIFANPTNGIPYGWTKEGNVGNFECFQDPDWGMAKGSYLPNENTVKYSTGEDLGSTSIIGIWQNIPVNPSQWYIASVYMGNHRASKVEMILQFYRSDNTVIGSAVHTTANPKSFAGIVNADRVFRKVKTPADCKYIRMHLRKSATVTGANPANSYMFVCRPMLEECTEHTREPSPWQNAGVTAIHGGSIVTNTITAQQMAANTITANEIASNAIAAHHLSANSVNAGHVVSQSLTADKLNINSLSAISANLGAVTAGSIRGVTITGNTISGNTISGGTISGTTISGTTINGGTIKGARIEGITIEAQNIIGDVVKVYSSSLRKVKRDYVIDQIVIPRSNKNRIAFLMPVLLVQISTWYRPGPGENDVGDWSTTSATTIQVLMNGQLKLSASTNGYDGQNHVVTLQGTIELPANTDITLSFTHNGGSAVPEGTQFVFFINNV
ncbi:MULTISPECIES: phage tail protein [Glaesserella]|uniref:Host specificity protein J n=1 Tax=Glaesserella australis TaxID=2094024 RepID=A0A328BYC8_9PAST|nr:MULTISPECIES: phage tail protein [Glaesserella]AUI65634.1 host specificity protein J [Glaesserella sp. 15-184]RAL19079.1 host specificity protein J [Glaesserella australis]